MQSPPQETSEAASVQSQNSGVHLLDDDGDISMQLEVCLKHIFAKYCTPSPSIPEDPLSMSTPPENAYLSSAGLDAWARDTNGAAFSEDQKEEIQYLDVTDDGCLTFKGFMQLYQLQTENDEEETWRDLSSHGFDRSLKLVAKSEVAKGDAAQ